MIKLYFTVLCCLLLLGITAQAQQPLVHKAKTYKAPNGKLYLQKHLPIYLYLSTEPNGKGEMIQLQSDSTKAFANPMYLDTEGFNSFRSPSAVDTVTKQIHYPLTDIIYEFYADGAAPVTSIKIESNQRYRGQTQMYVGNGVKINFNSTDALSGVEQILIAIDSAPFVPYTGEFEPKAEKTYTIAYYAVDNVGNAEKVKHTSFTVDVTAPKSELVFEGERFETIISGKTRLKIASTDAISGVASVRYKLDNLAEANYYSPVNAALLTEGEHTITYYATDHAGNIESKNTYTFFVDKTPPILVDEIMGSSYMANGKEYSSGRTKLKLTAVDNKAGVREIKYAINNEPYVNYEKPFYLSTVSGSLSVVSYAIDNVGNKSVVSEKSTRNKAAFVDLSGPQLKFNFIGKVFTTRDTTYINKDTKINIQASDPESGLKAVSYSINEGKETEFTAPFNIADEGVLQLNIYGYDNVDNSNRMSTTLVIDNQGPEVYSRFSILPIGKKVVDSVESDVYASHAVLFLSATDTRVAIDRIYYSVNGEKEQMYTGIIENFKRGKDYVIKVKAYDKLGNVNEQTIRFATDNSGPEVMTRFSVNPVSQLTSNGVQLDVYPAHVSLFLSVTNAPVAYDRIYYSVNGAKEKLYQGIIDGFTAGADVKMSIRAVDKLGNQTSKDIRFVIEK